MNDLTDTRRPIDIARAMGAREKWDRKQALFTLPGLPVDKDIPQMRNKLQQLGDKLDGTLNELMAQMYPKAKTFFESVAEEWSQLFPQIAARPVRYENDYLILAVASPAVMFSVRPKCRKIKETLLAMPGAPKKLTIKLEIRK